MILSWEQNNRAELNNDTVVFCRASYSYFIIEHLCNMDKLNWLNQHRPIELNTYIIVFCRAALWLNLIHLGIDELCNTFI